MKPKQCLETLKIRKMISFPSFTPAEGLCHLSSFNLNSEERDREVLRAVFSFWATVLPGNLDTRPFSGDSCIYPLGSKGWKHTLPPEPPRRALFPGTRETLTPVLLWNLCFWVRTAMSLRILAELIHPSSLSLTMCYLTTRNHGGDRCSLGQLRHRKHHRVYLYNLVFLS